MSGNRRISILDEIVPLFFHLARALPALLLNKIVRMLIGQLLSRACGLLDIVGNQPDRQKANKKSAEPTVQGWDECCAGARQAATASRATSFKPVACRRRLKAPAWLRRRTALGGPWHAPSLSRRSGPPRPASPSAKKRSNAWWPHRSRYKARLKAGVEAKNQHPAAPPLNHARNNSRVSRTMGLAVDRAPGSSAPRGLRRMRRTGEARVLIRMSTQKPAPSDGGQKSSAARRVV